MKLARRLPLLPSMGGAATRSDPTWRGPPPADAATRGGENAVAAHGKQQQAHRLFFRIRVELHLSRDNIYREPLAVQPLVVGIGMILYLSSWWRTSSPRARPDWVEPAMGAVEGCGGVGGR